MRFVLILAAIAGACYILAVATPNAMARSSYPVSAEAMRWVAPKGFILDALCIHRHESIDWHRRWVDWAGRPSKYAGGMQFLQSTWERAGGRGEPWHWGPREQVYRAYRIWRMYRTSWRPGSWSEWGTRRKCGLS